MNLIATLPHTLTGFLAEVGILFFVLFVLLFLSLYLDWERGEMERQNEEQEEFLLSERDAEI